MMDQIVAIRHYLVEGDRLYQHAARLALRIGELRQHLHRLDRQFERLAFVRRVQLIEIPGFCLLQLLRRRLKGGIAFDQFFQQRRQPLGKAAGAEDQPVVFAGGEADAANRRLRVKLIQRQAGEIVVEAKQHLLARVADGVLVAQRQRYRGFRLAGVKTARHPVDRHAEVVGQRDRMAVAFAILRDQGEIVRNIGVQRRHRQLDLAGALAPVGKGLVADAIDLIGRVNEVGLFVVRLLRTDIPDARMLRRHLVEARFNGGGIIVVSQVWRVQRMLYRHAQHGVRQPLDVIHIARQ